MNRQVRPFVASTFKDFAEERSYLVEHVFPRLRRLCSTRGVDWYEIELRWGVQADLDTARKIVQCLDEVERSRPWFIGLVGARYGWQPAPEALASVATSHPWVANYPGRSITELEIRQAVLRGTPPSQGTAIYLRRPRVGEAIEPGSDALRCELLAAADSQGLILREFTTREELGQIVYEDFSRWIEEAWPETPGQDQQSVQERLQLAVLDRVTPEDAPRPELLDRLDEEAARGGAACLLAEEGAGATHVLATWIRRLKKHGRPVLFHFAGHETGAGGLAVLLRRWNSSIAAELGIQAPPPDATLAEQRVWFRTRLPAAAPVALCIDDLPALAPAQDEWLPSPLPENVFVLATTDRPPSKDRSGSLPWRIVELPHLDEQALLHWFPKLAARFGKTFPAGLLRKIVQLPAAGMPLYSRLLLDDLRTQQGLKEVESRLEEFSRTASLGELIGLVLHRLQNQHGEELTLDVLAQLTIANRGRSQYEMATVLQLQHGEEARERWDRLHAAAPALFAERGGLLVPASSSVAHLASELVHAHRRDKARHAALNVFSAPGHDEDRRLDEIPHLLIGLEATDSLERFLTDMVIFLQLYHRRRDLLVEACRWLRERVNLVDLFAKAADHWRTVTSSDRVKEIPDALDAVGYLLHERLGCTTGVESFFLESIQLTIARDGFESESVLTSRNNLAALYSTQGRHREAAAEHQQILAKRRLQLGDAHLSTITSASNLADSWHLAEQLDEAEGVLLEWLPIADTHLPEVEPLRWILLANLGQLRRTQGRLSEALEASEYALNRLQQALGRDDVHALRVENNVAWLLVELGQTCKGIPALQDLLQAQERVFGPRDPLVATTCNNLGSAFGRLGKFQRAIPLTARAHTLRLEALGAHHHLTIEARLNLASQYLQRDGIAAAAMVGPWIRESLKARKRQFGLENLETLNAASIFGRLLYETRRHDLSARVYRLVRRLRSSLLDPDHPTVLLVETNLAVQYEALGRFSDALPLRHHVFQVRNLITGPDAPATRHAQSALEGLQKRIASAGKGSTCV